MLYTGRLLGEEYGELKTLTPLSFTCEVKGMALTATVIGRLNHPVNFFYRVRFSDGYISDFASTETARWYDMANEKDYRENKKHAYSPYADAIQNDLADLHLYEIYDESYCFRMPVHGALTNVYLLKDTEEDGGFYNVRYNGKYQFSLIKKGGVWNAGSKHDKKLKIDEELARNVSLMIETYR
jgi:hypothetical protein